MGTYGKIREISWNIVGNINIWDIAWNIVGIQSMLIDDKKDGMDGKTMAASKCTDWMFFREFLHGSMQ